MGKKVSNDHKDSLTVSVKDLLPILSLAKAFTATRDIVPVLKCLYFQGDTVRAFSGEAGAVWYTPWKMPGEFAVPADTLVRLVDSLHAQGHEEVTLTRTEASLVLRASGFRAVLPTLPETERSAFVFRDPPEKGKVSVSKEFWQDADRTVGTICQDETKPMLRGIFWGPSGKFLISTDAFRITVAHMSAGAVAAPRPTGVLIPDHLLSRCGARRREIISVALEGEGLLWFFFESGAVYGSLLQAEFPSGRSIEFIKKVREAERAHGSWITLPSGPPVEQAMDRLLYLAEGPVFKVSGEITKDALILRVGGQEGPSAEESFPAQVKGEQGTFSVNGKFFRDALGISHRFWVQPGETLDPLYFVAENHLTEQIVLRLR